MLTSLVQSRKVWLAVVAIAHVFASHYGILTNVEAAEVSGILVALITGIAIEDHGKGPKAVAALGDVLVTTEEKKS